MKVERYEITINRLLYFSHIIYLLFSDHTTEARSFTEVASSFARTLGMEQCGHMAICDAHARYRDYGIIALPLILLFPG